MKLVSSCCALLLVVAFFCACNHPQPANKKAMPPPSFKSVFNIRYTEVRRCFNNGYSFSNDGYQIVPNWRLAFPTDDSVNIWNPKRGLFVNAPVTFDHDSVFNVAWAWLRLKKATKDSLVFQVLQVSNKVIENEKSVVYMTLYADDYIRHVLHKNPLEMQAPTAADTAFIKRKTARAQKDPSQAFSATSPVRLIPRTPLITVERTKMETDTVAADMPPIDYMLPEFNITIHKAYEDFHYAFSVWVDDKGIMTFRKSVDHLEPEFEAAYNKAMKGIVNGYLKAYLNIVPGSTLGIRHNSIIILNVSGTAK